MSPETVQVTFSRAPNSGTGENQGAPGYSQWMGLGLWAPLLWVCPLLDSVCSDFLAFRIGSLAQGAAMCWDPGMAMLCASLAAHTRPVSPVVIQNCDLVFGRL